MANKQAIYTFKGINKDISHSKQDFNYYFDAQHIKLLSTDKKASGSLSNEKGNEMVVSIPKVNHLPSINSVNYIIDGIQYKLFYNDSSEFTTVPSGLSNDNIIIGHTTTRDGIILITTDGNGFDCIWEVKNILSNDYKLQLLYVRNLGLSKDNPLQMIFNYENENIQKIYWVDGKHQVRFLNIKHAEIEDNGALIDVPKDTLNFVGEVTFSEPKITNILSGGLHTSGMIQYAYNLYRLNGSQTKISPLSELIALDKGDSLGGGALNEVVGGTVAVNIKNIDLKYTHIKVYAIKYTSYGEIPSINLIEERTLNNDSDITIYDDGSVLSPLALDEFIFLGSDPTVPKHIETKDSRMFLANLQDNFFVLPEELDFRAYSFNKNTTSSLVWEKLSLTPSGEINKTINYVDVFPPYNIWQKHDSINLEYDTRRYKYNSNIEGGSGRFIEYELLQLTKQELDKDPEEYRFYKDREIYRIGIVLYNNLGQTSLPQWIADFKAGVGNLSGKYNALKVKLTNEFYIWLNSYNFKTEADKPVGYKIVRAKREGSDRTIICQGALTHMMARSTNRITDNGVSPEWREEESKDLVKFPTLVSRGFKYPIVPPIRPVEHLRRLNRGEGLNEVYEGSTGSKRRQNSWQYSRMFQLNSPDVLFETGIYFNDSMTLNIIGVVKYNRSDLQYKRIQYPSRSEIMNRTLNNSTDFYSDGDISWLGLFGPSDKSDEMDFTLINREYNTFIPTLNSVVVQIYGKPELSERGHGPRSYNKNGELQYANNMLSLLTDRENESDNKAITSMNSYGCKTITIVEGIDNIPITARKKLEELYAMTGITDDGLLFAEITIPHKLIYLGNIYGGNTYEEKLRTEYIEIGAYSEIDNASLTILGGGDTFVQNYRFARLSKTDTEILNDQVLQLTEIVTFPVESTIDLKNRNDESISSWNSTFQPRYEEYHDYNRVYSQESDLIKQVAQDFTFRRIKNFDTRIQATKIKTPNETIDSWTNILNNEKMDLDGKYGPINNIVLYEDEMHSFQDSAIANIAINPRIQVQGSDGVSIDLGTGGILHDYKYLTTTSGSINKWGIQPTKKGIYYFDGLNKGLGRAPDMTKLFLSDIKGQHVLFNNNFIYDDIKIDNPIINKGVNMGYDSYNNDVYITLHQSDKSFTACFNEALDEFVDTKTYKPSGYISKGEKFITYGPSNTSLYEQYKGEYNRFYGIMQESFIILQLNPAGNLTAIFDNIEFNSELYLDDIDQPDKTLTHIQAYNEYQDSGKIPLIVGRGSNIRRKLRRWRADIPRDGRARIRNPWIFLKLSLSNEDNYKLILHDIIIDYTV